MRILSGLESQDAGEIRIQGLDVSRAAPEQRSIGMVFQNYALWPHLTVFKNVAFPLEVRGIDKATTKDRVATLLKKTGLTAVANSFPNQLSGGQQQRVALARALAVSPSVLLLDEPFSNLDAGLREEVRSVIKQIQNEEGLTVIIVSHDFEDVQAIGTDVIFLKEGYVAQVGSPRVLYQDPVGLDVAQSTGLINRVGGGWIRPELCFLGEQKAVGSMVQSGSEDLNQISVTVEVVLFSRGFFKIKSSMREYLVPAKKGLDIKVGDTVSICFDENDVKRGSDAAA